jgi:hypothetical protein
VLRPIDPVDPRMVMRRLRDALRDPALLVTRADDGEGRPVDAGEEGLDEGEGPDFEPELEPGSDELADPEADDDWLEEAPPVD